MSKFKDQKSINQVLIHLSQQQSSDEIKFIKLLLSLIKLNKDTMIKTEVYPKIDKKPMKTSLFNIVGNDNHKLVDYLAENHSKLFLDTILNYLYKYGEDFYYERDLISFLSNKPEELNTFWLKFTKLTFELCIIIQKQHNNIDIINTKLIMVLTNRWMRKCMVGDQNCR